MAPLLRFPVDGQAFCKPPLDGKLSAKSNNEGIENVLIVLEKV